MVGSSVRADDGWMDGWMGGWMDGWLNGWMDEWMDGWMDGLMGGWMDGLMGGWMDGLMGSTRWNFHKQLVCFPLVFFCRQRVVRICWAPRLGLIRSASLNLCLLLFGFVPVREYAFDYWNVPRNWSYKPNKKLEIRCWFLKLRLANWNTSQENFFQKKVWVSRLTTTANL